MQNDTTDDMNINVGWVMIRAPDLNNSICYVNEKNKWILDICHCSNRKTMRALYKTLQMYLFSVIRDWKQKKRLKRRAKNKERTNGRKETKEKYLYFFIRQILQFLEVGGLSIEWITWLCLQGYLNHFSKYVQNDFISTSKR